MEVYSLHFKARKATVLITESYQPTSHIQGHDVHTEFRASWPINAHLIGIRRHKLYKAGLILNL
jgi:hypothetical protein